MGLRVLVADDSRIFRVLVREVLAELGATVFEASTGKEALDNALGLRPELLILDALMPQLSGFEVITKLKEKAPEYRPKIFVVTAVYKSYRWESEAKSVYQVDEYLEKPLEPETLIKAVHRHFPELAG
jgi:CheY-like chemotaxis protein